MDERLLFQEKQLPPFNFQKWWSLGEVDRDNMLFEYLNYVPRKEYARIKVILHREKLKNNEVKRG
jgi:hypothetical protein